MLTVTLSTLAGNSTSTLGGAIDRMSGHADTTNSLNLGLLTGLFTVRVPVRELTFLSELRPRGLTETSRERSLAPKRSGPIRSALGQKDRQAAEQQLPLAYDELRTQAGGREVGFGTRGGKRPVRSNVGV